MLTYIQSLLLKRADIILELIRVIPPLSFQSCKTIIALSELSDKSCGSVTSGIQEPQLFPGLQKDMQLKTKKKKKNQMSNTGHM